MNFFEFVNYYRIKEFIQLAESEKLKNLTFAAIAEEAGFNSKATLIKFLRRSLEKHRENILLNTVKYSNRYYNPSP